MSKYTTEVRYICEHYAGLDESKGYNNVAEIIAGSRTKIFDFSFPIFDETYRSVLETKILKHYYTREIGAESVGLWKLWLDTRLNEIMPYYNQLYESTLIEFNPLNDVSLTTDRNGELAGERQDRNGLNETNNRTTSNTSHGESTSDTSASGTSSGTITENKWDYYSDTPQGGINGLDANTYLTNARHNTNNETNSSTTSNTGSVENENDITSSGTDNNTRNVTDNKNSNYSNTEEWLEHITGKRGSTTYSKMLQEYRDTFLNIDMKIINDLSDLFMNVW
jgi:hypothetical protein